MTNLKVLSIVDWKTKISSGEKPVLVDLQAPWHALPFPESDPFFKLLDEARGQVEVVQWDITEFLPAPMAERLFPFPSLLLFHQGKLLEVCVGLGGVEAMSHKLSALIQSRSRYVKKREISEKKMTRRA
jgi:thioredoxin-like negative regulator of GroEL